MVTTLLRITGLAFQNLSSLVRLAGLEILHGSLVLLIPASDPVFCA
jgi:hypothetical protein